MAMEVQRQVVEYFRSLELALNEQEKKGTPKGDPTYSRIYTQLARDTAEIGITRDELPEAAKICGDRKSTRLNSSHGYISYAVFCLKKKNAPCITISGVCTFSTYVIGERSMRKSASVSGSPTKRAMNCLHVGGTSVSKMTRIDRPNM